MTLRKFPKTVERSRLLIVEGSDEDNLFSCLLAEMGSKTDVQIISLGGISNMLVTLQLILNLEKFSIVEKMAIIRDADASSSDAFTGVVNILNKLALNPPNTPTVFAGGKPSVGIFIMPGKGQTGALEKICLDALQNFAVMTCVDNYISCVQNQAASW